jgi:hypothetical protein
MSDFVNQITGDGGNPNYACVDLVLKKGSRETGYCFIAEDDEDEIDRDSRVVRINIPLPADFFEPLKVTISANEELTNGLVGSIQSVTVPVEVGGNVGDMIVETTVSESKVNGGILLAMLRRAVSFLEDGNK